MTITISHNTLKECGAPNSLLEKFSQRWGSQVTMNDLVDGTAIVERSTTFDWEGVLWYLNMLEGCERINSERKSVVALLKEVMTATQHIEEPMCGLILRCTQNECAKRLVEATAEAIFMYEEE